LPVTLTRRLLTSFLTGCLLVALAIPAGAITLPHGFGSSIDPYARYVSQTQCLGVEQPGARELRALLQRTYGANSGGILRACGQGGTSEHKEGRAYDWMLNASNPADRAKADAFLKWLLATDAAGNRHAMARRLGVMYVIWDRRIWKAYQPSAGWQPYSGASPHTDHIHISLSWAGARRETSFHTGASAVTASSTQSTTTTVAAVSPGGNGFGDVPAGAPFATGVGWLTDVGIVKGIGADRFAPHASLTRGAAVTMLWRLVGRPAVSTPHGFVDVPADSPLAPALRWGRASGLIDARDGRFGVADRLSRGEFALLLWRLTGRADVPGGLAFGDVPPSSPYHRAVAWTSHHRISRGSATDRFGANEAVTRAQAAVMLWRLAGSEPAWSQADRPPAVARY
jgi:hypothetical protein